MIKFFRSVMFAAMLFVPLLHAAEKTTYSLNEDLLLDNTVEFVSYQGPGQFDNYLAMNIPFEPMADLFRQLLIFERTQLTSRGEAHITVVTPIEYWNVLRPAGVSISEIDQIAESMDIQASQFEIVCLGQGSVMLDGKAERTFFVVVNSEDLTKIRQEIQKLLISKGGEANAFAPTNFFPHITLGFTKRDLHESDGITKNNVSCVSELKLTQTQKLNSLRKDSK